MATDPVPVAGGPTVVVAINAGRRCADTLEMAAAFATATGASLEVVLVEDADLLRLADLPVSREVDWLSGITREIDSGRVLRTMHCEARQLRAELARIGRVTAVRSSLRVVRGRIFGEALAASANVDVTFVHGAQHRLSRSRLHGSMPLRAAAARRVRSPVLGLFKGGEESVRALRVAAQLAHAVDTGLTVLLPSPRVEDVERYRREARETVGETKIKFVEGAEGRSLMLGRMLAPGSGSLLVLAKRSPELDDEATRRFLEELAIPLVLVG